MRSSPHPTETRNAIAEALEEICATSAVTDPAIRAYLGAKLAAFWEQGARSKDALVAAVYPAGSPRHSSTT